jgi:phospholipase C
LPSTVAYEPKDHPVYPPPYKPTLPTVQALPQQETGIRPARAVPYVCSVSGKLGPDHNEFRIQFANQGTVAAVYQVYAGSGQFAPRTYTVAPNTEVSDTWHYGSSNLGEYHLLVFGPNGFYRVFKGSFDAVSANLQTRVIYDITGNGIYLEVTNDNSVGVPLRLFDYYTQESSRRYVDANDTFKEFLSLEQFYGWYDISVETDADPTFQARLAGHLETGEDSMSDPSLNGRWAKP